MTTTASTAETGLDAVAELAAQLRVDSIRASTSAGSGHPTSSMSAADLAAVLVTRHLRYDWDDPRSPANDHLIFSKGHASPLLYSVFKAVGVVTEKELLNGYRRFDQRLEGHPTPVLPWVDVATGSLGQGLPDGVGVALAGKYLDRRPYRVWVLTGDSELAEGSIWEALDKASYYKLSNLVAIADINRLGQRGPTEFQWDLDAYVRRAEAFGARVLVVDGHDLTAIDDALAKAGDVTGDLTGDLTGATGGDADGERPTVIVAKTIKGRGFPEIEDADGWHGRPLPEDMAERAIAGLGGVRNLLISGLRPDPATKGAAKDPAKGAAAKGAAAKDPAGKAAAAKDAAVPRQAGTAQAGATQARATQAGAGGAAGTADGGQATPGAAPPRYAVGDKVATRKAYGDALAALGARDPRVVALDGEVSNSTYASEFARAYPDRYFEMFIAEQQMIAAATGLAVRGYRPFASTFAAFLTRAYDFIRMGSISRADLRLMGSHAGVEIGADGPSQMGLEDLAMFRAVHGSTVLYPSDGTSAAALVGEMAERPGISYLRTTRGGYPGLYPAGEAFPVGGSKVLRTGGDVALVGAGVTLHECLRAADILGGEGIQARVIDCYSIKPIDTSTLTAAAEATSGRFVIAEDHHPEGGLGSAVTDALLAAGSPDLSVAHLAVREMPGSGSAAELLAWAGIDADAIVAAARRLTGAE